AAQNISDEQIKSQIDILNKDFRKLNSDVNKTPAFFKNLVADVGIEFCLAARDPAGMATNGITRTKTTVVDIGDKDRWFTTLRGGKDAWNTKKYINIWVCEAGEDLYGFAFLPGTADPPEADGLVISSEYFGSTGTAIASFPNHKGRTTTHEMGHYFNLEHLWGPDESECEEGDGVADTPVQFEATYDCASYPLKDDCSPTDNGILFFNYMDYVDDECMYMFTEGQKKRMNASLNGFRSTLLGQTNCALSTSTNDNLPENQIQIYPNPASGYLQVISKNTSSEKASTLYLFDYMGRILQSKISFGACTFDIAGYSPGVYWLKVDDYPQPHKIIISP
ncbi:MAG: M43 family zinc metalloprotease, partial [Bacteroidota bacterium]